jgi:hypothetical protein
MNKCVMALVPFLLLKVFYDFTIGISVKYLYSEASRRVSGISYIIMGQ